MNINCKGMFDYVKNKGKQVALSIVGGVIRPERFTAQELKAIKYAFNEYTTK